MNLAPYIGSPDALRDLPDRPAPVENAATWKDGKLATAELESKLGNPAVIRLPGNPQTITLREKGGRSAKLTATRDGAFRFATKQGTVYQIGL